MDDDESLEALTRTLCADQRHRWLNGDKRPVEAYLAEYSQLVEHTDSLLTLICNELALCDQFGNKPSEAELIARFPQCATELRQQLAVNAGVSPAFPTLDWLGGATGKKPVASIHVNTPRRFGGYELERQISAGGMGVVYQATKTELGGRIVAIKLIQPNLLLEPRAVDRFRAEAVAASRLNHPGVVSIFHYGEHQGQHFIEMEYVEGKNLAEVVANGKLAPEKAARVVREIADALQYAHEQGIVHRDIKPGNILMAHDGRLKIADFGLAKMLEADGHLTESDARIGTLDYMSPEQAQSRHQETGSRSDIYSLGGVLYCLLTGYPPVERGNQQEKLKQIIEDRPQPPEKLNPKIPSDLNTICLKCLEKLPEDRYATAAELRDDLDRFLHDQQILARPTSALQRVLRTCRPPRFGPEFKGWEVYAFGAALVMLVSSAVTAFAPRPGSFIFYAGLAPLFFFLVVRGVKRQATLERQLLMALVINVALSQIMNYLVFNRLIPSYGNNVWSPASVINCAVFIMLGVIFRTRYFFWVAGYFLAVGLLLAALPFEGACIGYGIAWALFLAYMGYRFTRIEGAC
ncbi:MAG: serine/threonine protein kinase [Planctomycetes bacterium]|nr:serine/threonine protein kinase [Planctomycetota bacterium]